MGCKEQSSITSIDIVNEWFTCLKAKVEKIQQDLRLKKSILTPNTLLFLSVSNLKSSSSVAHLVSLLLLVIIRSSLNGYGVLP